MRHFLWGLVVAGSAVVFASELYAADRFLQMDPTSPWQVTQETGTALASDAAGQEGDFSVGRAGLNVQREYKLKNGMPIDLGFSVQQYWIDDGTSVDLPASLQSKGMRVGAKMPMPFTANSHLFLGADTGAYFQTAQDHAFHSSGFRSKSRVYGIWKENDDLILVAGTMIRTDYENGSVMPFAGFKYVMNDRWSFLFLSDEPSVVYRVDERTQLKLQLGMYRDEFEVTSGGRKGDVVGVNEFHAGLGLDYQWTKAIASQVTVGWAFGRKYEYLQNEAKVSPDDTLFLGYVIRAEF